MSSLMTENAKNISKLEIGMSKQQVMKIMGDKSASQDRVTVTNPYKTDMVNREGKTYEVLYYYTQAIGVSPPFAFRVRDVDLTPLYILNNKLVGWGTSFLLTP